MVLRVYGTWVYGTWGIWCLGYMVFRVTAHGMYSVHFQNVGLTKYLTMYIFHSDL